jgi:TRAP-type mannitol/chloroaromatic compound transport system permease large subunit
MRAPTMPRRRPLAVLVAVFLGLGAPGTAAGTALGAVGAVSAAPFAGGHHDHDFDHGPGSRPER